MKIRRMVEILNKMKEKEKENNGVSGIEIR